mgnify:CR=1 FL=1
MTHIMDYTKEPMVRNDFDFDILIKDLKSYVDKFKALYAYEVINENPNEGKVSWIFVDSNELHEIFMNECKSENIYIQTKNGVVLGKPIISHNGDQAIKLYKHMIELLNRLQYSLMYDHSKSLYYDEFKISEFVERFDCNFVDEFINNLPTEDRFIFPYKNTDEYKFEFEYRDYKSAEHIDMRFNSPVQHLSYLDELIEQIETWKTKRVIEFQNEIIDRMVANGYFDDDDDEF